MVMKISRPILQMGSAQTTVPMARSSVPCTVGIMKFLVHCSSVYPVQKKKAGVSAVIWKSSCVAVVGLGGCVVLEIGVVAGGLGRDATGWIVDEHHLQQVEAVLIEVLAEGLTVIAGPLRKRGLEVWVASHTGPVILGGRSQNSADLCQRGSSEDRAPVEHYVFTGKS